MDTVNIYQAKTRLSQLVDQAAAGKDVIVSRNGRPLARLSPLVPVKRPIRFGVLKGKVRVAPDFDAPLPDEVIRAFEGALMRLLLDTHVFLWAVSNDRALKPAARKVIESADQVFVSAASLWEVALKSRLGKIEADAEELAAAIEASGFFELPVRAVHAVGTAKLPPHHHDPFDRLLIAQALAEPLKLLTADAQLARYTELVVLA